MTKKYEPPTVTELDTEPRKHDLPESLVREICAGRLAEIAWTGGASDREALLRASYFLSSDANDQVWPAPTAADRAAAATWLRALAGSATRFAQWAVGARRASSTTMAAVFINGAELLEQGVPRPEG